ncbi:DUF1194 domain-containing protein [Rhodovulum sp. YNF3179]|uniref:DUF1194 domain-containing protein n=1 Tax=Rhodovulum sp. YNF3179 TaxID=3425127 RepID=UPI003D329E66
MRWLAALAAIFAGAAPARAACHLALALALDVSSSVDTAEYRLQRDGLAAALGAPSVQAALFAIPGQHVTLAAYEWSGRYRQRLVLDWTPVRGPADLARVRATIGAARRSARNFPTAMGYALGYGAGLLARAPACDRQVLDVSGDGLNNEGFPPDRAYAHFPFAGVTVNGLVIDQGDPRVVDFYIDEVLHGPGSFLERADGYADFERAMRRKLLREIRSMVVGAR